MRSSAAAAPLTTDRIDVSFPRVRQATVVSDTGQLATLPVRLSQLSVPALAGLRAVTPDQQARFDLALEAIKTFHTGVSEDVLLTNDNLKPVRDRLLTDAGALGGHPRARVVGESVRRKCCHLRVLRVTLLSASKQSHAPCRLRPGLAETRQILAPLSGETSAKSDKIDVVISSID